MKLIKNGRIHNALQREAFIADILVKDDKISRIEENISSIGLDGVEIIDASGLDIYPGFVDAHAHTGLSGYAIGYEGMDYNEINDPVCPHLRAIDALQPFDQSMKDAREAGVTCPRCGEQSITPYEQSSAAARRGSCASRRFYCRRTSPSHQSSSAFQRCRRYRSA